MVSVKDLLQLMWDGTADVCEKRYLLERPQATDKKDDVFLVLDLFGGVVNREIGGKGQYGYFTTEAEFRLYVRDQQGANNSTRPNILEIEERLQLLLGAFPIKQEGVGLFTRPDVWMRGKDDKGFHWVSVIADCTTLF